MSQSLSTTTKSVQIASHSSVHKQIFHALLSIASAALLIRVMGMLNQIIVSSRFGAGATMDAYIVASFTPILIAQLVVSATENAVIPVYTRIRTTGTREQASLLLSTLLNIIVIGGGLITLLLFLFRRQVIFLTAPALDPFRTILAVNLLPFLLPVLLLTVVIGFLECILNVEGQFGWPAYAGMLVPLATAAVVLTLGRTQGVLALAIGTVLGLVLQLGMFLLRAKRAGLTYQWVIDWRNPHLVLTFALAWPALLGAIVSQISPLIDQVFASYLSSGSISAISYSSKLFSVPLGVIAISVGRAAVPYLSRQAALNDMRAFKETLRLYLWLIGLGTLVLSIGMIVFAHPLVQIFFQRGQFTSTNTNHTAATLVGFAAGLAPTALVFVMVQAFSALSKTRVLMAMGLFNVIANALLDALFAPILQSEGIALATSVMYSCEVVILLLLLRRTLGPLSIFTAPPEILKFTRNTRIWLRYKRDDIFSFGISRALGRKLWCIGLACAVFVAGIVGAVLDYSYALRISLGSLALFVFLRYRYLFLIICILLTALIDSPFPIFQARNLTSSLTAVNIVLVLSLPIMRGLRRMPALIFLVLFLLWIFIGALISPLGTSAALTIWLIYLNYAAVSLLTIFSVTTERRLTTAIDALLLFALFVAIYGIYGYLTKQNGWNDPTQGTFRIFSIYGSPPSLALYLSVVFPLALYRTITAQGIIRIIGLIGILLLLAATGLTFTRSAFLAIPFSIIIMVFFLPSRRLKIAILSTFMLLTLVVVFLAEAIHIPIFIRFFQQDFTTLNGRTNIWQALLARFDPTRLLGAGLGASNSILGNLGVNGVTGITNYESHNLYLGILYDHGIIGDALLITIFVTLLATMIIGIRRTTGKHQLLFVTAFATSISVVLQSVQTNDIFILSIGLYFWVIVALPFTCCWPSVRPRRNALESTASVAMSMKGE